MPSTVEPFVSEARTALTHLMLWNVEPDIDQALASVLSDDGAGWSRSVNESSAVDVFNSRRPDVLIVTERSLEALSGESRLLSRAKAAGVPILAVLTEPPQPEAVDRLADVDDWVTSRRLFEEFPARLARLLSRRPASREDAPDNREKTPADGWFSGLVVHDLRTPLNVIGLSLRMIAQSVPRGDPELEEDLRFVDENLRQIERMLSQLSDYYRLFEAERPTEAVAFSPRRLAAELLESRLTRSSSKSVEVVLKVDPSCPDEVTLDPVRARLALQSVLNNAANATKTEPVRLGLRGAAGRWMIEVAVDTPPPSSVHSTALSGTMFERLCGSAAERRGMDLAIAARVTEGFGGVARLDVEPNCGTVVLLDWPDRLPGA